MTYTDYDEEWVDEEWVDEEWVDEEFDDDDNMLTCPACGASVHEDTQQCPACGDWIIPVDRGDKTKSAIWTVAALLIILAFLMFALR